MAYGPEIRSYRGAATAASSVVIDAGLRAYMLRVYNWMASGLLLTGIVSYGISQSSLINALYPMVQNANGDMVRSTSLLAYIAIFSPMAFVLVLSLGVNKLSTRTAQGLFWAFCAAMGLSLTNIFLIYTQSSVVEVFFITAGTFGAMSLYGYTTGTDLTKMGSFLIMGVVGLLIAMVVNFFMHSSALQFMISILGVLIFTGLIAYDTQRIKADYVQFGNSFGLDLANKRSVYDALTLYLNFINLFMFLLQLMGNRRGN
ncbi:MAG TPA: Bax inhibitor-1/YccA family protein [Acetobacteraceae bacterium]|jgi:FtsH-binding integral membrane protein|nr:Bax inhibitor-1/YccA family protein [Acetobacteraceae bacterium]